MFQRDVVYFSLKIKCKTDSCKILSFILVQSLQFFANAYTSFLSLYLYLLSLHPPSPYADTLCTEVTLKGAAKMYGLYFPFMHKML